MSFNKTAISAIVSIGSLFMATSAMADVIDQPTQTISEATNWATNGGLTGAGGSTLEDAAHPVTAVTFDKFDASLGTLTGMQFTFSGEMEGTLTFQNFGGTLTVTEAIAGATIQFDIFNDGTSEHSAQAEQTFVDAGGASLAVDALVAIDGSGSFGVDFVDATALGFTLDQFIGAGETFDVGCAAENFQILASTGPGFGAFAGSGACGVDVHYEYRVTPPQNDVPEPATLALLGLGLAGLGMRRKAA